MVERIKDPSRRISSRWDNAETGGDGIGSSKAGCVGVGVEGFFVGTEYLVPELVEVLEAVLAGLHRAVSVPSPFPGFFLPFGVNSAGSSSSFEGADWGASASAWKSESMPSRTARLYSRAPAMSR